jgi:hypothetical protein
VENRGKDTLSSLRHDGRARTYAVHLPPSSMAGAATGNRWPI